ncbi:hypothetical protein SMICM304S_04940 [Streptomyces microflavus]
MRAPSPLLSEPFGRESRGGVVEETPLVVIDGVAVDNKSGVLVAVADGVALNITGAMNHKVFHPRHGHPPKRAGPFAAGARTISCGIGAPSL